MDRCMCLWCGMGCVGCGVGCVWCGIGCVWRGGGGRLPPHLPAELVEAPLLLELLHGGHLAKVGDGRRGRLLLPLRLLVRPQFALERLREGVLRLQPERLPLAQKLARLLSQPIELLGPEQRPGGRADDDHLRRAQVEEAAASWPEHLSVTVAGLPSGQLRGGSGIPPHRERRAVPSRNERVHRGEAKQHRGHQQSSHGASCRRDSGTSRRRP